jgi:hypothetical protein
MVPGPVGAACAIGAAPNSSADVSAPALAAPTAAMRTERNENNIVNSFFGYKTDTTNVIQKFLGKPWK